MRTSRSRAGQDDNERTAAHGPAAGRKTAPGSAAVPPPLTADALRAAQHGAGNAAVTGMIARRARATPAPEQPDPGVHEVLRSAGKPLAEPVRQEMEARLGADFSDVRLHTGATARRSAAGIGARAYTSGSHIVIGDGGGDKHTLAHELTHVIQQRRGPVLGTDNGSGLSISNPSDRFEHEAEANARRVLSGPVPVARAVDTGATAPGAGPVASPDTAQVQRAVGFEFEVTDGWRFYEYDEDESSKHLKKDTKEALIPLGDSYVSADNGNVEFVTKPLSDIATVEKALGEIVEFHTKLTSSKNHREGPYEITTGSQGKAKPQATLGIKMEHIGTLVKTLRDRSRQADEPPPSKMGRTLRSRDSGRKERVEISNRVTNGLSNLPVAHDRAEQIAAAGDGFASMEASVKQEVTGFLAVIMKTLDDAGGRGSELVDPKYFFSMMPRTDFFSMHRSMSEEAKEWLSNHRDDVYTAMGTAGFPVDEPVFGSPYKMEVDPEEGLDPRMTRRTWLDPVLGGHSARVPDASSLPLKDTMSPPPGYPRHKGERADEGLGAMSTDQEGLSLFELRDLGKHAMPKEQWTPLAVFIAHMVGDATNDDRLKP
ncbi:hypothetical protein CD934_15885 [Streptomyces calvus]|uniref:eCIS core domain-containing protein n=2 Tax=Streptomyces calvus TaxID=67282 RepID=A0A514JRN0_9ACTN|nr:hypothetical protein CD934_15885 [Streptomyces calvus]